jgi:putative SOS response-associated peptidase YedK
MCGRFVIAFTDGFHVRFKVPEDIEMVTPRFNIAPSQRSPIILRESPNRLEMMRWGLIPSFAKEKNMGLKMINARAETVNEKTMFKKLMTRNRCLVPATGFYEWMKTDDGKVPYYIKPRDKRYISFAGLYDNWRSPEDGTISSFTILTTTANDLMRPIHDRMPVILKEDDEEKWLEKVELEDRELRAMFTPYPSDELEAYQVAKLVRNPAVETADLIRPVERQTRTIQMHL